MIWISRTRNGIGNRLVHLTSTVRNWPSSAQLAGPTVRSSRGGTWYANGPLDPTRHETQVRTYFGVRERTDEPEGPLTSSVPPGCISVTSGSGLECAYSRLKGRKGVVRGVAEGR